MINEQEISVANLVALESFQAYCLNPNSTEAREWLAWLADHPDSQHILEEAREMVWDIHHQLSDKAVAEAYGQFKSATASAPKVKSIRPFQRWAAIAASFLLLAVGAWAFLQWSAPSPMLAFTPYGEHQHITLPDGSKVMLNGNTQMKWAESWSADAPREVWLKGEAFFEVAHNPSWPFVVHTEQGDIRVLGTTFNARQRKDAISVALVEGKVSFELAGQPNQLMSPGQELSWKNGKLSLKEADLEPILAWSQGKMIFRNASIASIIDRLEDDFGWQISVEVEAILDKKVNASIDENVPEVLLEALAAIYDLNFEKKGPKTYIIR